MTLPVTALPLGGLLAGGRTSNQNTVSTTNTLNSAINPVNTVNIGGGVMAQPYGPVTGSPTASANASLDPGSSGFGLGGLGSLGSAVGGLSSSAPPSTPGLLSGNTPLYIGGGLLLFFILTRRKKGKS